MQSQIYKRNPRTCANLIPTWGSSWGYLSFSHNQNNRGLSGVYMSPTSTCTAVWMWRLDIPHGTQRSLKHLSFPLLFCVCGRQKTRTSPIWVPCMTTLLHMALFQIWDPLLYLWIQHIERGGDFAAVNFLHIDEHIHKENNKMILLLKNLKVLINSDKWGVTDMRKKNYS